MSIQMCKSRCMWITQEGEWGKEKKTLCRGHRKTIDHAGGGGHWVQIFWLFSKGEGEKKKAYSYWVFPFTSSIAHGCKLLLPADKFCSKHYFSWFFVNSQLFIFSFTWIFLPSRILTDNFSQSALFHLFYVMLSWIINSRRDSRKVHFKDNISYLLSHEEKTAQTFKSLLNLFNRKTFETAPFHIGLGKRLVYILLNILSIYLFSILFYFLRQSLTL